ncbi:MAG: hypothetical protein ACI8PZ_002439 [Myxococcota bacterium]|jgi:hypothetical protein
MSERAAFVLPTGLDLDLAGDALSVRFDGDVTLETTLGRRLEHVEATGDITLDLPLVTGTVIAGGKLTIRGEVDASRLSGRHVEIGRQKVKCEAISAHHRISIGAASLKVDAIIAPEIVLDPNASGRVTVIESHNDRGASKIKGGFSVADYEDMIGSADEFLSARGLTRLSDNADTVAMSSDEDIEDPESLSIEDIEPIDDLVEPVHSSDYALDAKLDDAVTRVLSCYQDAADIPPSVTTLRTIVADRDYALLGERITDVWNDLLSYHQQRGIRPHHQVTHAFNVIHGLVTR